jgi:hypothetical protein
MARSRRRRARDAPTRGGRRGHGGRRSGGVLPCSWSKAGSRAARSRADGMVARLHVLSSLPSAGCGAAFPPCHGGSSSGGWRGHGDSSYGGGCGHSHGQREVGTTVGASPLLLLRRQGDDDVLEILDQESRGRRRLGTSASFDNDAGPLTPIPTLPLSQQAATVARFEERARGGARRSGGGGGAGIGWTSSGRLGLRRRRGSGASVHRRGQPTFPSERGHERGGWCVGPVPADEGAPGLLRIRRKQEADAFLGSSRRTPQQSGKLEKPVWMVLAIAK